MPKYPIEIEINAPSQEEALALANALIQVKNNLSDTDLKELAKILKNNPGVVKKAKMFL